VQNKAATLDALLLTVRDACGLVQVSRSVGYELINRGEWRVIRIGRSVRIPRAALIDWIEQKQTQTDGADDAARGVLPPAQAKAPTPQRGVNG